MQLCINVLQSCDGLADAGYFASFWVPYMPSTLLPSLFIVTVVFPGAARQSFCPVNAILNRSPPPPTLPAAWEHNLQGYTTAHPEVRVIDRVDGIRLLQNRATMLNVLNGNGIALDAAQEVRACCTWRSVLCPVQLLSGTALCCMCYACTA